MIDLAIKGINYDVGTAYLKGMSSRTTWSQDAAREEIRVIAEELHCTAITIFGTDPARIIEAGRYALEQGLTVWLQPRPGEVPARQALASLRQLAEAAEALHVRYPERVVLNIGCELSLFLRGIVPGWNFRIRTAMVMTTFGRHHGRRGAVVAFGDSITDGAFSTSGADNRYPDELAERLVAAGRPLGVLNAGIGGNRLLEDSPCFGERAVDRFPRDVLNEAGVRTVIVLDSTNDLLSISAPGPNEFGLNHPDLTAADLIKGFCDLTSLAHSRDIRIIGATVLPTPTRSAPSSTAATASTPTTPASAHGSRHRPEHPLTEQSGSREGHRAIP